LTAHIYESAFITLAATLSSQPESGCYSRTNSHHSRAFTLPTGGRADAQKQYTVCARTSIAYYEGQYTLLHKGWVMQEIILSTRIRYFTEDELRRECNYGDFCECSSAKSHGKGVSRLKKTQLNELVYSYLWHTQWQYIVAEYTRKSLTYSSDIFPALQGLANKGSHVLGKYLGGLWDTTLI
jgi:hypothetical protein